MRAGGQQAMITRIIITITFITLTSEGARNSRPKIQDNQATYRPYGKDRQSDRQRYIGTDPETDYEAYYDTYDEGDGFCDIELSCRTETDENVPPTSMKLPIRGPRGPPGVPGRPGQDGLPGLPGPQGISAPEPSRVAFFVGLSDNLGPIKDRRQTPVVFDRVVTNIGGAYSRATGRFTSPVNGTYQFNVVISAQGRHRAAVMIVKNGAMVATVWAESVPYWSTSTNVVVLSLQRGEQVWLRSL